MATGTTIGGAQPTPETGHSAPLFCSEHDDAMAQLWDQLILLDDFPESGDVARWGATPYVRHPLPCVPAGNLTGGPSWKCSGNTPEQTVGPKDSMVASRLSGRPNGVARANAWGPPAETDKKTKCTTAGQRKSQKRGFVTRHLECDVMFKLTPEATQQALKRQGDLWEILDEADKNGFAGACCLMPPPRCKRPKAVRKPQMAF